MGGARNQRTTGGRVLLKKGLTNHPSLQLLASPLWRGFFMASVRQMEATATAKKPLGLAEAEKLNFL